MSAVVTYVARRVLPGLLLLFGIALAPAAIARSHSSFGISIGGPGYGVSYSGCRHCGGGWWNGYAGSGWGVPRHGGYYGGYYGAVVAPVYYASPYYDDYYPAYTGVRYERPAVRRVYRVRQIDRYAHDDDYDDDDDDRSSHSDRYYDDADYDRLDREYRD